MNCPTCGKLMYTSYADYYRGSWDCDCNTNVRIETVNKDTHPMEIKTTVIKNGKIVDTKIGPGLY